MKQRLIDSKRRRARTVNATAKIWWIEKLLQIPISDYRKFTVWRILAPYLINIRKYTDEEAFNPIRDWLNRCNELRRLQFNGVYLIKYNINSAKRNAYLPRTLLKSGYIGYFISSWIMSEKFSLTQMCGAPDYKHSLK